MLDEIKNESEIREKSLTRILIKEAIRVNEIAMQQSPIQIFGLNRVTINIPDKSFAELMMEQLGDTKKSGYDLEKLVDVAARYILDGMQSSRESKEEAFLDRIIKDIIRVNELTIQQLSNPTFGPNRVTINKPDQSFVQLRMQHINDIEKREDL